MFYSCRTKSFCFIVAFRSPRCCFARYHSRICFVCKRQTQRYETLRVASHSCLTFAISNIEAKASSEIYKALNANDEEVGWGEEVAARGERLTSVFRRSLYVNWLIESVGGCVPPRARRTLRQRDSVESISSNPESWSSRKLLLTRWFSWMMSRVAF